MTALAFDDTNGNGITRDAPLDSGDTFDSRVKNTLFGGSGGSNSSLIVYQGSGVGARKVGATGGGGFTVGNYTARDTTTVTYRNIMVKMTVTTYGALNAAGMDFCIGSGTGAAIGNNQHFWTIADDGTIPASGWEVNAKGGWEIKPVDVTLRAFRRGESGTPDETAMLNFGAWADLNSTAGTDQNLLIDSPDWVETGFHVVSGTGADPSITFQAVADEDEGEGSTNFDRAGLWQTLADGVFQFFGGLEVGRTYGNTVTESRFIDSFKTLVCPGGYVREGFNYLEFDIGNASSDYDLDNITILGTGRTSQKRLFDATIEGSNGDVDETLDEINYVAHGFQTAEQILYDREGNTGYVTGAAANGESELVTGTTGEYYYAIRVSADVFAVATSFANALAGTRQALTAQAGEIHSFIRTPDTRPDIIVTGTSGAFDYTNGNITSARQITLQTNAELLNTQLITCGKLFLNGGSLNGATVRAPTVFPGEHFLECIDTGLLNIDATEFIAESGSTRGPGHAIKVTSATAASSRSYAGNTHTGYASYSGTDHPFDGSSAGVVDTVGNDITISSHPYVDGELVYYEDNGGTPIGGLTDGELLYIGSIDANTIALYRTLIDATGDTNRISLTAVGTGTTHRFDSANAAIFNDSGNSWTLAIADGDTPSIRNSGIGNVTVTNNITLTFTPLQTNSEVRVYLAGTSTEVDGVENSGASFAAAVPAATNLDYKIFNPGFKDITVKTVQFAASQNVIVNQQVDRDFITDAP